MCVKNTTYNGCDNVVWSPTNYTTWVVEHVKLPIGKTNTPLRKIFPLAPLKKIVKLITTLFNFHKYAFTPCLPSNTKALHRSQIFTQSPISEK